MKRQLNLIAFDIPYPPDYGGIIDIYYKIRGFKESGYKVHLHCFQYCRESAKELENICETVTYYKRQVSKANLFNLKPYIVVSRSNSELLYNILNNKFPILFEGLHSCYYLNHRLLQNRIKVVRAHNIEHNYYQNLAKVEKDIFRKYYFFNEASKLKRYEKVLSHADAIAAISKNDYLYFNKRYNNAALISAFHPSDKVEINEGKGKYCLYHGSLDVGENNEAAMYLVNNIFNDIDIPLIIAGNKPGNELRQAVEKSNGNIQLKDNITSDEIYELLRKAQINILPTFQATGIKLKLLASLFKGRHCIVNSFMVEKTGLEDLCIIREEPQEIKSEIHRLFNIPFTPEDIEKREKSLNNSDFSNKKNISKLIKLLFPLTV